ncbi:GNAT family N-acetyltransferase [Nostocoides sp. F2B08]|uniref:GNAT family N-acetyltransferase n=1 Tax=Nostocoides sp. F2B08 TaxID=2653936 RepID=UPI001263C7BD|nr:GNAT family N-acetyltransferase [Tetrasphaera sp. F2B08]KAB7744119.1 GNAT family N-acetyltransferase [Tetrasphaera sp. F2B08]
MTTQAPYRHRQRAALTSDASFLQRLFTDDRRPMLTAAGLTRATLDGLLAMQWRAQRASHARMHPQPLDSIIEVGGRAVGRVLIDRAADRTHLVDIALLPEWRGRGIGTAVVQDLISDARSRGDAVTLSVARDNDRAVRLYRRLGFVDDEACTPSATYTALRCT